MLQRETEAIDRISCAILKTEVSFFLMNSLLKVDRSSREERCPGTPNSFGSIQVCCERDVEWERVPDYGNAKKKFLFDDFRALNLELPDSDNFYRSCSYSD